MTFSRLPNETEEQFLYRICQRKEEIGTWEEIANVMNYEFNHSFSSSKYRKQFSSFKKMFEANENILSKSYDEDLLKLKEEIKNERIKLQTCNIEKNRIDRHDARTSLWYEQISNCIKILEPPKFDRILSKHKNIKYVQTLADVHMGADFISSNNIYNFDVVENRFVELLSETEKFIHDKNLSELTIVGLGDAIHGILRYNDLRINHSTVVEATVRISNLISEYLNELSKSCKIVYYDVLYGNHSQQRYLGSKANAMMDEDLGYVIGNFIKTALLKNDRVKVILPFNGDMYLDISNIFDFKIVACHGHQFKNIGNAIKDLSFLRQTVYDYLIIGHHHNERSIVVGEGPGYDIEVLVSPSFCGSDKFSDSLFKGSRPASMIYGFDERFGHVETYKIVLT